MLVLLVLKVLKEHKVLLAQHHQFQVLLVFKVLKGLWVFKVLKETKGLLVI
jgi:hypothetical protein